VRELVEFKVEAIFADCDSRLGIFNSQSYDDTE
jgi:hypothetical protein